MRKLLFLFLLLPVFGFAKDFQVKIHVEHLPREAKPLLLRIFNGNTYMVDSVPVMDGNQLSFKVPDRMHAGMMQVMLGATEYDQYMNRPPRSVLFLFNHEDVELAVDFNEPSNVRVIQSPTNIDYFNFQKTDDVFFRKLGTLEQVLVNYPDRDEFYDLAADYYVKYQYVRERMIDSIYQASPSSLVAKIINGRKMPFLAGNLSNQERDSVFKETFFYKIDFTDTTLLYTSVYTDKLYQYINSLFSNTLTPRENEENVIAGLDKLFPYINQNDIVRDYLMQFLITSFENMKMEGVLTHISQNYAQQCGSSVDILAERLEKYKKMAVGNTVPDFIVTDINGNPVSLYTGASSYNLLVFWHSECSHCTHMIEEISKWVGKGIFKEHGVNIITVSIDEKRENWEAFSARHKMNWTNAYAEGTFTSQVATDYNIFATPTLFLLNSNNEIIAKPLTVGEVIEEIEGL
ncbi:TlpA family protein disulfide reductase [Porphyromonadaceae bacterium OttesenSCG-928-L07]|nr:TlpA family protein disulfide reductase [Porphyromonadaceae bacterium OttesenSCG-928-L07]MDL2251611.1 TlpA family protein disulfide reductase [Odoribacter sp. OttesenSCG-928-J03]MDL2330689.1 TlpA family protein disulfide reductase [Odoribacter sp. OttesenSCG-928-A06]